MPKYVITRTYKHTETIEVDAPSKAEAWVKSISSEDEFIHNNDDWLYDEEVNEVQLTKPFRCHDADACAGGFNRCPMPWACGVEPEKKVGLFRKVFDAFVAPSCCDVTDMDCNQGRDCPVRSGEYKPAEAMHHIQEPSK